MTEQKTNAGQGLGIAALILGCIAFPISLIPCFNFSAILFAVVGIILSAIGLSQATKQNGAKGLNLAGLLLSGLALLIIVVWTLALSNGIANRNTFKHEIQRVFKEDFSKNIEEEIENATENVRDDLEKQLEELESDSLAIFEEAKASSIDQMLKEYEKLTQEIYTLSEKVKEKDMTAVTKYAKVVSESATLTARLAKKVPDMSTEQVQRYEEIQKKYVNALEKAGK